MSAWGNSWGTSWADSWGAAVPAPTPVPNPAVLGGGAWWPATLEKKERLTYLEWRLDARPGRFVIRGRPARFVIKRRLQAQGGRIVHRGHGAQACVSVAGGMRLDVAGPFDAEAQEIFELFREGVL